MWWLLVLAVILALCALAYRHRVKLLAKGLNQPERRVRRQLGHEEEPPSDPLK